MFLAQFILVKYIDLRIFIRAGEMAQAVMFGIEAWGPECGSQCPCKGQDVVMCGRKSGTEAQNHKHLYGLLANEFRQIDKLWVQ